MVFYVYELRDPNTLLPFYVGKGKGDRMYRHERAVLTWKNPRVRNPYLFNKIKKIIDQGDRILTQKVFETDDENLAFTKERLLIQEYRSLGYKLCNLLDGGEGHSGYGHPHSEETKKKISDASKGVAKSEEHKEALRQAKLAHPVRYWEGKTLTSEHKQRLKDSKKKCFLISGVKEITNANGLRAKYRLSRYSYYKMLSEGNIVILEVENAADDKVSECTGR